MPWQILETIKKPEFDPEEQQYVVLCVNDWQNPLTYTGTENPAFNGSLIGKGISMQGNTLAARKENLPIEEILMKALEVGAELGADKRCGERKAASAFLTVAKPDDNAKNPYINLIVLEDNDSTNAVETLRKKFNTWKGQPHK